MTTDIEAQIIALVAQHAEVNPARVTLTSRLLHDLGIDGDVADEFFDEMRARFGTDLTHLDARWSRHFGPEHFPFWVLVAAVAGGATAAIWAGVMIGDLAALIAGLAVFFIALASRPIGVTLRLIKPITPISVAQVVAAVEAGAWPAPAQVASPSRIAE